MIQIAICDDERVDQLKLKIACEEWLDAKNLDYNICCFDSGEELIESGLRFHAYFLDMEMRGISGLSISAYLSDTCENYILFFFSNHDKFMEFSFGKNVYGFLSKPVSQWKLNRLMEKMYVYYQDHFEPHFILLTNKREVLLRDIQFIQANDNYSELHMTAGESYIERQTLQNWAIQLEREPFSRIHKSTIVNLEYVRMIQDNSVYMIDGTKLKIGRSYKRGFKERYMIYRKKRARY